MHSSRKPLLPKDSHTALPEPRGVVGKQHKLRAARWEVSRFMHTIMERATTKRSARLGDGPGPYL